MKYTIHRTAQFKKEYKQAVRRGYDTDKLRAIVTDLADGFPLPHRCKDHELKGKFAGQRECHIEPDWLLVYQIIDNDLILRLMRTGTHSDIFPRKRG